MLYPIGETNLQILKICHLFFVNKRSPNLLRFENKLRIYDIPKYQGGENDVRRDSFKRTDF